MIVNFEGYVSTLDSTSSQSHQTASILNQCLQNIGLQF
jgi:hypothetical protein